jgi:glycosyltransferase involved in cell wall biosynthesis
MTNLPRTLFVARRRTAVAWYRCALPAEFLGADWVAIEDRTGDIQLVSGPRPVPVTRWSEYDAVVLQQPRGSAWLARIRDLQAAGVRVLYEIDDYVHAVRKARDHDFKGAFDKRALRELELAMRVADGLICSTEWLAGRYRSFNPRVHVCRNGLDLGRYAMTLPPRDAAVIGWAGGTGHKNAVRPWLTAVADVMRARPDVRFHSVGQPFDRLLAREFGDERCTGTPFTTLDTYAAAMTHIDVAIAPAGPGNFFRGKSDLRFLEAAALGQAVVADPIVYPTIEHGVTGLHAATVDEAREHLLALVDDRAERERLGANARAYVERERDMRVMARQWANALSAVCADVPADDAAAAPA